MINLLASWLSILQPTAARPSSLVTAAFQQLCIDSFSPALADSVFSSSSSTPSWLQSLLASSSWRSVFRQLQELYPRSLFVAFVIKAMEGSERPAGAAGDAEAGREGEDDSSVSMDALRQTTEQALTAIIDGEDARECETRLQRLRQQGGRSERGYLYTQQLLSSLSASSSSSLSFLCRRLSQELSLHTASSASASSASRCLFDFLLLRSHRHAEASAALLPFYRSLASCSPSALSLPLLSSSLPSVVPTDLLKLYTAYASDSPPPVSLLQSAPLLSSLLQSLLAPSSPLPSHQIIYLLCYASASPSVSSSPSSPSVSALIASMTSLVALVTGKGWMLTPQSSLRQLRSALSQPLLSSLCLLFVHSQLTSAAYYDATASSSLTPQLASLLGQLAALHPLHVPAVHATVTAAFLLPSLSSSLSSLALIALRKQLLLLLLHLLLLQHRPALTFVRSQAAHMDHSLLRLFCLGVITAVAPPLSLALVQEIIALLSQDAAVSAMRLVLALMGVTIAEEEERTAKGATVAVEEGGGERTRKRLRRLQGSDTEAEAEPQQEEATAMVEEDSRKRKRRPVRTRPFLSDVGDGSGGLSEEEVQDIRELALSLLQLRDALRSAQDSSALYIDDGSVDRQHLLQQLDGFFSLLHSQSASVIV